MHYNAVCRECDLACRVEQCGFQCPSCQWKLVTFSSLSTKKGFASAWLNREKSEVRRFLAVEDPEDTISLEKGKTNDSFSLLSQLVSISKLWIKNELITFSRSHNNRNAKPALRMCISPSFMTTRKVSDAWQKS